MNNKKTKDMLWSYSRLSSFYNCPYCWYEAYVNKERGCGNFFSSYGSMMHSILQEYAEGKLTIFELNDEFTKRFGEIPEDAPKNKYVDIRDSYFNKGINFLNNININFDKYEILSVEKKITFEINGYKFIGYIDILLKDKSTGEIIVLDYKSRRVDTLKNGNLSKGSLRQLEDFKKQLYIYSKAVFEEYGKYPDKIAWDHFNDIKFVFVDFDIDEYNKTLEWVKETIVLIENEFDYGKWLPNNDNVFYCKELCGMRKICQYKKER